MKDIKKSLSLTLPSREGKEKWERKKIKDIGLTQTGLTPSKSDKSNYGNYISFVRPAELNIDGSGNIEYDTELKLSESGVKKSRLIKANSTMMCCIGSVGKIGFTTIDVTCNQQINTITPTEEYNPKFIYYALLSPEFQKEVVKIANSAKATLPIISKGKWEVLTIPVPSLSEQQNIVRYLDESFAKIDALKANAEKSLADAKALFQAELKKAMEPKEGWENKTIDDYAIIIHGKNQKNVLNPNGTYPIYGSGGNVMGFADDYLCESGTTILGRKGTIDNPIFIEEKFWNVDTAFGISAKDNCNKKFLYYRIKNEDWVKRNSGTTLPSLTQTTVKNVSMSAPSLEDQQSIVTHLDTLSAKVTQLQQNFEKIKMECDALKQALLKHVFE